MLKSLSQIVGEMTNQVRATNDRVAALESANETERTERNDVDASRGTRGDARG